MMPKKLHGSIRKIQVVGNPFRDRMHKMMQRNLVEVNGVGHAVSKETSFCQLQEDPEIRKAKLRDRDKSWKLEDEESEA